MLLDKLPVSGRSTNLENSRVSAYCACSRCGWGTVFSNLSFFSFVSPLWETA